MHSLRPCARRYYAFCYFTEVPSLSSKRFITVLLLFTEFKRISSYIARRSDLSFDLRARCVRSFQSEIIFQSSFLNRELSHSIFEATALDHAERNDVISIKEMRFTHALVYTVDKRRKVRYLDYLRINYSYKEYHQLSGFTTCG